MREIHSQLSGGRQGNAASEGANRSEGRPDGASGLQCIVIVARLRGMPADEMSLRHEFGSNRFGTPLILLAAKRLGMVGRVIRQGANRWAQAPLPAIAIERDGGYSVVAKYSEGRIPKVLVYRPGSAPEVFSITDFHASWTGEMIYLAARR